MSAPETPAFKETFNEDFPTDFPTEFNEDFPEVPLEDNGVGSFFSGFTPQTLKAGVLFIAAKLCGIAGILIGWAGWMMEDETMREVGGGLLALDAVLLALCIVICWREMTRQTRESDVTAERDAARKEADELRARIAELEGNAAV